MAAEPQPPVLADAGTESTIRRLLDRQAQLTDQQAEVHAQLAALLPSKYGSNIKLESLMLRHKLHALRAYAALYGKSTPGVMACLDPMHAQLIPCLVLLIKYTTWNPRRSPVPG